MDKQARHTSSFHLCSGDAAVNIKLCVNVEFLLDSLLAYRAFAFKTNMDKVDDYLLTLVREQLPGQYQLCGSNI